MLHVAPFVLYLIALAGLVFGRPGRLALVAAWACGCALHAWILFNPGADIGFSFTFFNATALTALLINALVLLWARIQSTWHLGLLTLPIALVAVWIEPDAAGAAAATAWNVNAHILISLLAYGLVVLAGAQALMLLLKEHQLNAHQLVGMSARLLPPLDRMEALLFELIALSLILLSIGLAVGSSALSAPFSPGMLHKTVFSFLAWGMLVLLLWGRWQFGWRGRLAAGMTLGALGLLALGFLGTKLVLEFILNRAV